MDVEEAKVLRSKLAVIRTFLRNVAGLGSTLDDNRTRDEYRKMYEDISSTLDDPNFKTYVPGISYGKSMGGSGKLWQSHQVEIVNSATRLISYLEAVLTSDSPSKEPDEPSPERPAAIFISHGKRSKSLDLLRDFVTSLGLIPVIVMDQPSHGMSLDTKVTRYMNTCQAAIILATGDDKAEGSGKLQPRQNVIHEIGLAQEILANRVVYLLEENTEFPSNIKPKVYERFGSDNLTLAFIAVARDLRALGLF